MILLAIDTSTETASIALARDEQLIAETTWFCGQNHTVQLLLRIKDLLEKAGINIQTIGGIAVARGPGSFNGLRVGISTAKGLAFSLNVPLAGASTLEISAYQHAESGIPICVIHNAGRNEIATATYQMIDGCWQQLVPEHITTLENLLEKTHEKTLFCGEYIPDIVEVINYKLNSLAVIAIAASIPRRAFYLAELGRRQIISGKCEPVASLQPLYLRRPPITERKHV